MPLTPKGASSEQEHRCGDEPLVTPPTKEIPGVKCVQSISNYKTLMQGTEGNFREGSASLQIAHMAQGSA